MKIIRAVLLGYTLHDYKSELKKGDLIAIDNGYDDEIYILDKIDPRYGKLDDEPDTIFKYCIYGQYNSDRFINYEREEISKAHVAFFDYQKYYKEGKKILLGAISFEDLTYIKAKYANDLEIPFSEFHIIKMTDLIGLDFQGYIVDKDINYDSQPGTKHVIKYYKIDKPE